MDRITNGRKDVHRNDRHAGLDTERQSKIGGGVHV
jgi:hypothetical protein